jgi:hypothetical protein
MAFPIVDGISLLHWHLNRGKRSVVLDLRTPEGAATISISCAVPTRSSKACVPVRWRARGLGYDDLRKVNPKIVFCTHSGYGMTGPYKDMPSHGIAYDAWAGVARPSYNDEGQPTIPSYTTIGINAGPLYAALGICAAIIRARATGRGCWFEVAQSDAAAAFNWNGIEGNKAYERPEDEVTGNDGDGKGPRRPVGDDSMKESVRYQYYRSKDGLVLFMASEREFWKNFCEGIGRPELFEQNPGAKYADHARGNVALRRELARIFATRHDGGVGGVRPAREHAGLSGEHGEDDHEGPPVPGAPALRPYREAGTDLMPSPIKPIGESLPVPAVAAREPGRDTEAVLRTCSATTTRRSRRSGEPRRWGRPRHSARHGARDRSTRCAPSARAAAWPRSATRSREPVRPAARSVSRVD